MRTIARPQDSPSHGFAFRRGHHHLCRRGLASVLESDSIPELLAGWDTAVSASDETTMYAVTLRLPDVVKGGQCAAYTSSPAFFDQQQADGKAKVDAVTAANGGARAIDVYSAWHSYVTLVRTSC